MKSVGEAMAIGRNFTEALQKALRSLESPDAPFDWSHRHVDLDDDHLLTEAATPHDGRLRVVMDAIRAGATPEEVHEATGIDPWFVDQLCLINEIAQEVIGGPRADTGAAAPGQAARLLRRPDRPDAEPERAGRARGPARARDPAGLQDRRHLCGRVRRRDAVPLLVVRRGDRGAAAAGGRAAVIILGSGPNRIGQGIEFDYSCVHASLALNEAGYETIMVNCNPETVSTDYDTSDRLYFEPLTLEDVLEIVHAEQQAGPVAGVICQLGGQTPLGLAQGLADAGVPIVGTTPEAIHLAEERGAFGRVLAEAGLPGAQARHGVVVRRGAGDRPRDRLPGAGAAVVRPGRARHGDRLRRRRARGLHRPGDRDQPGAPGAGRPVHRRRGRDRRRRAVRRRGALPRRRHGAHRGGRHPLRRLVVRAAADHARRQRDPPDPRGHRGDRARGRRPRPDQHPVRARLRRALRAGGQPAGVPHRAVRLQGDGGAAGQGRGPGDARRVDRVAARGRGCWPPRATGETCRPTRRSRSRRR